MIENIWKANYRELAKGLKEFYYNNIGKDKSAGELFYDLCTSKENIKEFNSLFGWSKNITQKSIDPIHIFSSFNNSGTTMDKKKKRFWFYYKILRNTNVILYLNTDNLIDNRFSVPHIAIIFVVADRKVEYQKQIWDFFYSVMIEDKKGIRLGFNQQKDWFGIGFTVLTEFLFWVDSDNYISLDKNTKQLLKKYNYKISNNYESYMKSMQDIKSRSSDFDVFRILVKYSYIKKEPDNSLEREIIHNVLYQKERQDSREVKTTIKKQYKQQDIKFQLIAIQPLENCKDKYLKTLNKKELYQFNDKFYLKRII